MKADLDFQTQEDANGNLTLLIPNMAVDLTKRPYHRIEFDQTLAHIHHASDFNIPLPSDFDMNTYNSLDRAGKIDYAKNKLSQETILNYQNAIGRSMSPEFGPGKTFSVPGVSGRRKRFNELTIQPTDI